MSRLDGERERATQEERDRQLHEAADRILARSAENHIRRAAYAAATPVGVGLESMRDAQVIQELLWALVKRSGGGLGG